MQLTRLLPEQLAANGVPQQLVDRFQGAGGTGSDFNDLVGVGTDLGAAILAGVPEQLRPLVEPYVPSIVTSIYESIALAIGSIFWLGAAAAVIGFAAVLVIRELPLRTTLGPVAAQPVASTDPASTPATTPAPATGPTEATT
jgi:hypothetical protein